MNIVETWRAASLQLFLYVKFEFGIKPACVFLQEVIFFARLVVNHVHGAFDVVVSECKLGVYVVFRYVHFRCYC